MQYAIRAVRFAQVGVAGTALGYTKFSPRTMGALGVVASALSLYQLTPAMAKPKTA